MRAQRHFANGGTQRVPQLYAADERPANTRQEFDRFTGHRRTDLTTQRRKCALNRARATRAAEHPVAIYERIDAGATGRKHGAHPVKCDNRTPHERHTQPPAGIGHDKACRPVVGGVEHHIVIGEQPLGFFGGQAVYNWADAAVRHRACQLIAGPFGFVFANISFAVERLAREVVAFDRVEVEQRDGAHLGGSEQRQRRGCEATGTDHRDPRGGEFCGAGLAYTRQRNVATLPFTSVGMFELHENQASALCRIGWWHPAIRVLIAPRVVAVVRFL